MADDRVIRILCAGAVKVGVEKSADLFESETGLPYELEHATGPVIKARVAAGEADVDLVAAPRAAFDDLIAGGHFEAGDIALIGFITVAVTARYDAHRPDLSSIDAFVTSVLAAERLYHSAATSGLYVAGVFDRLGLTDKLRHKVTVCATGNATMEAVAADTTGRGLGFGHATEIRLHDHRGTRLIGPLPAEIGRPTSYAIGIRSGARQAEAARRLIDLMVSARGKKIFVDSGVLRAV